jgi:aryl-alcohol dehydrogenase-like predicted oxidoreductase
MGAGAAWALDVQELLAQQKLLTRAVPSTGEQLPLVGLGSSATFSQVARADDVKAIGEVLKTLVSGGGTVFDTAPGYGASEEVAGRVAADLGLTDRIFWATKVNVAMGRGGDGGADAGAARKQIDQSFARIKKAKIDLIQVHNLGDVPTQLGILKELKAQGRVRYIGVTTTFDQQYDQLADIMRREPLDFIGVDYAIDAREMEQTIFPLAQERKIGVLAYQPFGRTRLWNRVGSAPVPEYAKEFDAATWAQFFIKFVASHPAVTVVTPATSQAKNMLDNLGAGRGRMPDAAMRKRMIATVDALPRG